MVEVGSRDNSSAFQLRKLGQEKTPSCRTINHLYRMRHDEASGDPKESVTRLLVDYCSLQAIYHGNRNVGYESSCH